MVFLPTPVLLALMTTASLATRKISLKRCKIPRRKVSLVLQRVKMVAEEMTEEVEHSTGTTEKETTDLPVNLRMNTTALPRTKIPVSCSLFTIIVYLGQNNEGRHRLQKKNSQESRTASEASTTTSRHTRIKLGGLDSVVKHLPKEARAKAITEEPTEPAPQPQKPEPKEPVPEPTPAPPPPKPQVEAPKETKEPEPPLSKSQKNKKKNKKNKEVM